MPDLEHPDDPKDTAKLKAVLLVVATVAFVVTPFLTQPFTGFDSAQLPVPVEEPPIQPEGYAFSIWGVIYLWLLGSAGYGLIKRDTAEDWDAGRWGLIVSIAIGASWIAIALRDPVIATALIWVMLIGALWALVRAPQRDRAWNALPLGLYAGWLTAASCVALGTVAMGYGLGSPVAISWAGLALALAIAVPLARRLRVPTYPIAVAWALFGVVVANAATLTAFAVVAGIGAAGLLWLAMTQARA
ncbi:hypothetical protein HKCCSP123_05040 [Rhodobacterales bacterium HKCCSP123]|nr:hypothetical protein [Rhodobacterales bacterium HKCCSP123]